VKAILPLLFFFTSAGHVPVEKISKMSSPIQYLALGDSYTIGESVPASENFPQQVCRILGEKNTRCIHRIIAKTGWTTDELENGIKAAAETEPLLPTYDFVSLLIGVNNQYRGGSVEDYVSGFEGLLRKAVEFAGGRRDRVLVLSIPDWGVTPFAGGRDRTEIAHSIDAFNAAAKKICDRYNIYYIDITPWTREAALDPSLLAADGLHPSGHEYRRWAEKVSEYFHKKLQ
jgi:lysophospholipase L1-like esterase